MYICIMDGNRGMDYWIIGLSDVVIRLEFNANLNLNFFNFNVK